MEANTPDRLAEIAIREKSHNGVVMGSRETEQEPPAAGTPEDVAVLYQWANLDGAKYRDFSASRREYRAQVRYRAAQQLRERELLAQAAAEAAAAAAERAALAAEAAARSQSGSDSQVLRVQALRGAELAARQAAAERIEALRRGEAAAQAGTVAEREEREIAEAHRSARRQAQIYTESEMRRQRAGAQPGGPLPGEMGDPYTPLNGPSSESPNGTLNGSAGENGSSGSDASSMLNLSRDSAAPWRPQGYRPDEASGVWQVLQPALRLDPAGGLDRATAFGPDRRLDPEPGGATRGGETPDRALGRAAARDLERNGSRANSKLRSDSDSAAERAGPAWLYAPQTPPRTRAAPAAQPGDTLQDSRERVAARWFALKGVFEHAGPELPAMQPLLEDGTRTPLLLVFSLAGGVGKTSLVATLGRALSSQGERVVLGDTTSHGLLPFYFGARELRPGVVRSFSPPAGSDDAPISLVSYDAERKDEDERELLAEQIVRNGGGNHRVVLDVATGSSWLISRMAELHPTVLVPMAPDMNSVIGMQTVERSFQGIADLDGRPLLPFYVLNQFDATLPLHLDVREVFRRQLGDRLLRVAIRRSPAVSEALAEGMTVVDYAPAAPVSKDYLDVASWLRSVSPPVFAPAPPAVFPPGPALAAAGSRDGRWSGQ